MGDKACVGGTERLQLRYLPDLDRVVLDSDVRPRLLSVCFEPTNQCPGKCPYCLIEEHDRDWPASALEAVLEALLAHGTARFGFGGGEPLLREDLRDLGLLVRQHGAGALLRTSGMFPMDVPALSAAFDWFDLSFDSVDADVFRRCRPGVPHDVLIANLLGLVASGARVRVSVLITARNLESIDRTVRWLAATGVRHVRLQRLVRRGQAKVTWEKLSVPAEVVGAVLAEQVTVGKELGIDVRELKTVSDTTLCIVKGNGDFFSGEPTGIVRRGSVFQPPDLIDIASRLFDAQSRAYLHG
ncbi:radical SAM protein [Amycolatopsis sp. lyj-346]|uniref:radical SAM protein n=1 Tax=Amycolatopsis sp. lyj-346 TaxID=2789289 RepID=UPI00397C0BE7